MPQHKGPKLGPCLPHPQRHGGGTLGFAEAAPPGGLVQEHTQSVTHTHTHTHPSRRGPYRTPQHCTLPFASPRVLPNLPSESFARTEVIAWRGSLWLLNITGVSLSKPAVQTSTSLTADNIPLSSQGHEYSHPLANNTTLTPTRPFPHSVSHSHNHSLICHVVLPSFFP